MLSSKFGVGNSQFRVASLSGYVDTVPFGAFRREVFQKYGGYDERLIRNQDNEMNYRIRKSGGKIYLANDIKFTYYCRDTIKGISDMAFSNGMWNIVTMRLCPGAMSLRHFVPLLFLLSIFVLCLLGTVYEAFFWLLLIDLCAYIILDFLFSRKAAGTIKEAAMLLALFPIFHFSYGIGSVKGIVKVIAMPYHREAPAHYESKSN